MLTAPLPIPPRANIMNLTLIHSLAEIADHYANGHQTLSSPRVETVSGEILDIDAITYAAEDMVRHSLKWGDRLVVLCQPAKATIATMVAAWKAGVVVCPLPPDTRPEVLSAIARDCGARLAVDPARRHWMTIGPGHETSSILRFRTAPRVTGPDLALIIYSSGSTGSPKGIMLSHANVLSALRSISGYLNLTDTDIIYSVPPLHFDYGLYQVLLACFTGCRVVIAAAGTSALQALQAIANIRPTVLPIVPALGSGLGLLGQIRPEKQESVRLITNTGGHLPEGVIQSLQASFPRAGIMPMYGLTESKRALFLAPEHVFERPGSVGLPMPGLEAKVIVTEGSIRREAEPGETGELWVRGSSVMQGYTPAARGAGAQIVPGHWRDDNWLATGDIFTTDDDGFFYFRGRSKDLIKQGGHCLYPRDIEAVMEQHPHVLESIVLGIEDRHGDELACLFIRMNSESSPEEAVAWLQERFSSHYTPRRWHGVENWPLNSNGKIDRQALRTWATHAAPRTLFKASPATPPERVA